MLVQRFEQLNDQPFLLTPCWHTVVLMMGQHRGRWSSLKSTQGQRLLFTA